MTNGSGFRRRGAVGLFAATAMLGCLPAHAAAYPEKPVTIIVGFAAGGQVDLAARILAEQLSKRLGQPFVVENRPGASGNIATEAVANALADGYTLMVVASSLVLNATLFPDFEVDPSTDLVGVSRISTYPLYMVVPASGPDTVAAVIEQAKAEPGMLSYAISGFGTSTHIAGELFASQAGIDITEIPYKGGSESVTATVSGETQLHFGGTAVLPLIAADKLKLVAVTSEERMEKLPDTPTIGETIPGFSFVSWNGLFAPDGVSADVLDTLNKAVAEALADPEVVKSFEAGDTVPAPMTVQEFNEFYPQEQKFWSEIITQADITVQ